MDQSRMFDVVVFGSCIIDFISYVERLPTTGETLHGSKFATGYGGKGANQCVAAARLGSKTAMVSKLGNDSWGRDYYENLKKEGVNVDNIDIVDGETTGIAQINVANNGDNQIVIVTGANKRLCPADVNRIIYELANSKVLVCQFETPQSATIKALENFNGTSIVNAAPALKETPSELLKLPTIFCVNESEAAVLTGCKVDTIPDAKVALLKLKEMGCNTIIITLGKNGAIFSLKDSDKVKHIKGKKIDKVIDTTGAGDSFLGALAHFIAQYPHVELDQIIGASCEVASLSVQSLGTQSSFPKNTEIDINFEAGQFDWDLI